MSPKNHPPNGWRRLTSVRSALTATPAESGYDSDSLSQTERERRQALEYAEPDEPGSVVPQVQEVDVHIPNIPFPRSSDGQVTCCIPASTIY